MPLPDLTLTADKRRELGNHELIAKKLEADFYFAYPLSAQYSSWERGGNENANGLIGQYFPKGSDVTIITKRAASAGDAKNEQLS